MKLSIVNRSARSPVLHGVTVFVSMAVCCWATEIRADTLPQSTTSEDYAVKRGVVLGARTSMLPFASSIGMSTGISAGYKLDGAIFSLALSVVYGHSETTQPSFFGIETTETRQTSSVMINPDIQYAFAKFPKANFEFIIQGGLGLILAADETVTHSTNNGVEEGPWSSDNGRTLFDVQVAPGFRVWPHPNTAIVFVAGLDVGFASPSGAYGGLFLGPRVDLQWIAVF